MNPDFSYDPVTALDESSASGRTAEIFADIRHTMGIPLVTSIWRGLAGMDQSLDQVWTLVRPIHASGLPEQALARMLAATALPLPEPLPPPVLACVGLTQGDLQDIHAIVAAYNRSNGLNLAALAALVAPPVTAGEPSITVARTPAWPRLRPLLARDDIDAHTWSMIRQVNAFGAPGPDAGIATLWRHLAHWPELLAVVHCGFAPLQARGAIDAASAQMVELALEEGAGMAHLRPPQLGLAQPALDTITGYVRSPTQVARMVVVGHALARWLAPPDRLREASLG